MSRTNRENEIRFTDERRRSLRVHVVAAVLLGCLVVAFPLGIMFVIPWAIGILVRTALWSDAEVHRGKIASIHLAIGVILFIAAFLAPVKTIDRILDQKIRLPAREMKLGDFDWYRNDEFAVKLPTRIHQPHPENSIESELKLRFDRDEVTLRELLAVIESQADMKYRFSSCGNGSSILFGSDGHFGCFLIPIKRNERHDP